VTGAAGRGRCLSADDGRGPVELAEVRKRELVRRVSPATWSVAGARIATVKSMVWCSVGSACTLRLHCGSLSQTGAVAALHWGVVGEWWEEQAAW